MKRSWSYSDGQIQPLERQQFGLTGASLIPSNHPQLRRSNLSSSRASLDAASSGHENFSGAGDSPSESGSSRETSAVVKTSSLGQHQGKNKFHHNLATTMENKAAKEEPEQAVVHRVVSMDRVQLRDVVSQSLESIANRLWCQPEEYLEDLKAELRDMLAGTGGIRQREEFAILQKLLHSRRDLKPEALVKAHHSQLEILVAIKTGIQAFLHPDISITQSVLVDIFFHTRCRNIACQSNLPVDDCRCEICATKKGFCNACMCVICRKFDFDVNSCRWIGCDFCSHWTHTDCAIRAGQICMGPSPMKDGKNLEVIFRCRACGRPSELIGWVKDVFKSCASEWDNNTLAKELDCVRRIFHGSEDTNGRMVYRKTEELIEKLRNTGDVTFVSKEMQALFQEIETDHHGELSGEDRRLLEPEEACNRIAEVVKETIIRMESVTKERFLDLKRARSSFETSNRELADKKREAAELQCDKQRKKRQIDELEVIIKLKQAEANMFQSRADQARQEADELQRVAQAKSEKVEEEYASRYLKLRFNEAEAERRYLFEKIKLQGYPNIQADPSQMLNMCRIQYLFNQVSNPEKQIESSRASL